MNYYIDILYTRTHAYTHVHILYIVNVYKRAVVCIIATMHYFDSLHYYYYYYYIQFLTIIFNRRISVATRENERIIDGTYFMSALFHSLFFFVCLFRCIVWSLCNNDTYRPVTKAYKDGSSSLRVASLLSMVLQKENL